MLKIINSFNDSRIKLIRQENINTGASRNKALTLACGEYVMYLDGVDWYHPEALQIAYGERHGLYILSDD